jgi:hypothetical protein
MFVVLRSAFRSGRGWGEFYRRQYDRAIPDLEFAWRHKPSPILVGGPLGQAYARIGRDEEALQVLQELAAAVRAASKEIESDVGLRAALDGLMVLASLLDKRAQHRGGAGSCSRRENTL